jgi:Icc protein
MKDSYPYHSDDAVQVDARNELEEMVDGTLHGTTNEIVDGKVDEALGGKMDETVRGKVDEALGGKMDEIVDGKVDEALGGTIDERVNGKVDEALGGTTNEIVDGKVDEALGGTTNEIVDGKVDEALGGTTNETVRGKVDEALGGTIDERVNGTLSETMDETMRPITGIQRVPGMQVEQEMFACFQVISDTHVRADDDHLYNRHLELALQDIAASDYATASSGIMHVGDITDHGLAEEYEALQRILAKHHEGLPAIRYTVGNHDVALGKWAYRIASYESVTGMSGTYHDHWINGYHFIFLGTEQGLERFASLSDDQLAWLDEKLGEDAAARNPVFVFLHQPLKDTVAGSLAAQAWFGVEQDEALRAVLLKYPQAILFTGHTHWHLGSAHTMHREGEHGPVMFNAASVAYLWNDDDAYVQGSQGYYVEIYADCVLVRGRNFTDGSWVKEAYFEVPYPAGK